VDGGGHLGAVLARRPPRLRVIVFGGYGVFGSLVCRALADRGVHVTVAGRDLARATQLAQALGPAHRACAADVRSAGSARAALGGQRVAVHCAGPFAAQDPFLLEACLEARCHYVDIADDRAYVARVRSQAGRFHDAGLTAAVGCSSLPGLSGALAVLARAARTDAPARARLTLYIGNDNAKSAAAVRSVVSGLGQPMATPQGTRHAFRESERVLLPPPFGPRVAHLLDSPEYDLLPHALGVHDLCVLVGFENRAAGPAFALLARVGWRGGARAAAVLARAGSLIRTGSSGGGVIADLFWPDGTMHREGLHAPEGGQRLAALPAALVAHALAGDTSRPRGVVTAYELLGAGGLISAMESAGFQRLRT